MKSRRGVMVLSVVAAVLVVGCVVGGIASREATPETRRISVSWDGVPLQVALDELGRESGHTVFAEQTLSKDVTFEFHGPVDEAIARLTSAVGAVLVPLGSRAWLLEDQCRVTVQDGSMANVRTVVTLLVAYRGLGCYYATSAPDDESGGFDPVDLPWPRALEAIVTTVPSRMQVSRRGHVLVFARDRLPGPNATDLVAAERARYPDDERFADKDVMLDAREEPLPRFVERLSSAAGVPIRLEGEGSDDESVTVHARGTSWRGLVAFLARTTRRKLRIRAEGVLLEGGPHLSASRLPLRDWFELLAGRVGAEVVVPESAMEKKVDADIRATPVRDVLAMTAEAEGYVLEEQPGRVVVRRAKKGQ